MLVRCDRASFTDEPKDEEVLPKAAVFDTKEPPEALPLVQGICALNSRLINCVRCDHCFTFLGQSQHFGGGEERRSQENRVCYNCQEEGHLSRDCRKPKNEGRSATVLRRKPDAATYNGLFTR